MITSILEKCLAELGKETPRLDYMRGMLEVLLASQTNAPAVTVKLPQGNITPVAVGGTQSDEASILDARAKAAIDRVKAISEASLG